MQALREEIQSEAEKMVRFRLLIHAIIYSFLLSFVKLHKFQLSTQRKLWEAELEEKLQRAAAAHSEHIEEVVRVQRSLFEIEEKQKVGFLKSFLM